MIPEHFLERTLDTTWDHQYKEGMLDASIPMNANPIFLQNVSNQDMLMWQTEQKVEYQQTSFNNIINSHFFNLYKITNCYP